MSFSIQDTAECARAMGIDPAEIALRKAYLGIDEADCRLLCELAARLEAPEPGLIDDFYAHLLSFAPTHALLPNADAVSRLRQVQERYFSRLLSGQYDWPYVLDRLQIGRAHQSIGLQPTWYLGAYSVYLSVMMPRIWRAYADDPVKVQDTLRALVKIIFFDTSLALDTYFYTKQKENMALKERAEVSQFRLQSILDHLADGVITTDETGKIEAVNPAVERLFGYAGDSLIGNDISMLISEPSRPDYHAYSQSGFGNRMTTEADVDRLELDGVRRDGSIFPLDLAIRTVDIGQQRVLISVMRDISHAKTLQQEMRKLSQVVEQSGESVVITDHQGVITYVNDVFETVTGYSANEALGQTPRLFKSGKHSEEFYYRLWTTVKAGRVFSDIFINRRKNGLLYYEQKTITPIRNDRGEITSYVSNGTDITERMQAEERFHHLSNHDVLTDLPNRLLLMERTRQALKHARRGATLVAMLCIRVDGLKAINDTLGHETGDHLLKEISLRLLQAARYGDTVARVGGHVFGILLADLVSINDIPPIVDSIIARFDPPCIVNGQELHVTANVGISCYPTDSLEHNTLLKHADAAMHQAKERGRNRYRFYSEDIGKQALHRLKLERDLHRALENQEFVLHYQPQVDGHSGQIFGVESLLRWQHPRTGMMPPAEFVPLLEETGLIIPVGEWIMATAAKQCQIWHGASKAARVSINLSAGQLRDPRLVNKVENLLRHCGTPASLLEFEITESVVMQQPEVNIAQLQRLRELGVRLAIDDFGTGYSSLSYLKRLPINTLKMDKSFVNDIETDSNSAEIASLIISMARVLGLEVVAEGVATKGQFELLKARGCTLMQGHWFSEPQAADVISALLSSGKRLFG